MKCIHCEQDYDKLYLGVNADGESNIGYLCKTYLGDNDKENSMYIFTPVQGTNIVKIMRCSQIAPLN